MTLEEQRAIEEEARNLGMTEAEEKVQALREEKAKEKIHPGVAAPVPGRDSGFGSEQDPHTHEAGQGEKIIASIISLLMFPLNWSIQSTKVMTS